MCVVSVNSYVLRRHESLGLVGLHLDKVTCSSFPRRLARLGRIVLEAPEPGCWTNLSILRSGQAELALQRIKVHRAPNLRILLPGDEELYEDRDPRNLIEKTPLLLPVLQRELFFVALEKISLGEIADILKHSHILLFEGVQRRARLAGLVSALWNEPSLEALEMIEPLE